MSEKVGEYVVTGNAVGYLEGHETLGCVADWREEKIEHLERHVANRERYIAHLRQKLAAAAEEVRRVKQDRTQLMWQDSARITELLDALEPEQEKAARRLALLRCYEWLPRYAVKADHLGDFCRSCNGAEEDGHSPDCPLGAELKED